MSPAQTEMDVGEKTMKPRRNGQTMVSNVGTD